jgi:hypothetical protein
MQRVLVRLQGQEGNKESVALYLIASAVIDFPVPTVATDIVLWWHDVEEATRFTLARIIPCLST